MSARVADLARTERPVVELDDIACGYEGRPVLERLSLSLYPGQFAGIVGPSGSGKTTVLRAILGMADLYHGAVRFPNTPERRRPRIGYVPQLETIDWSFPVTVEQVVLMGLAAESGPFPWARKQDRHAMHVLLTTHDLNSVAAHLPWVICLNKRIVAQGTPDDVFTPEILGRTYGAEMVVVRQGDLILVSDRLAATRSADFEGRAENVGA